VEEREAIEADRDMRTVFAFNLPLRADEDDLTQFFNKAGKVRDIRLISDRNSRKSKGYQVKMIVVIFARFGYIEFYDKSAVPSAISLSGQTLMGHNIQVQATQAEKNRQASTT
jgi:RNA-binding protein 39